MTGSLYCNSCILRGVRNKRDVAQLSEGLQTKLIIAVKAAEKLVGMCLRSQQVSSCRHVLCIANGVWSVY